MDGIAAFAMGAANRGNPVRVFDWDKARRLIAERQPSTVRAGLQGDWEWTGGDIWRDGSPVPADDTYVYLASTWAVPEIEIDGDVEDCWRWQAETPGWGAGTYWPAEES